MSDAPCTRPTTAGEMIGDPCTDCGHTNVVHPGRLNPALTACVLCELVGQVEAKRRVADPEPRRTTKW